jgi:hypothetical protein
LKEWPEKVADSFAFGMTTQAQILQGFPDLVEGVTVMWLCSYVQSLDSTAA